MTKYRAVKVTTEYGTFDSKGEASRYAELMILQRVGQIKDVRRQVVFELLPAFQCAGRKERAITYVADFVYTNSRGESVVEDFKGFKTDVYKLKRKMFLSKFPQFVFLETGVKTEKSPLIRLSKKGGKP